MTQPTRQPSAKTRLSDQSIQLLTPPSIGRVVLRDSQLPQLTLLLGPRSRTWYAHVTIRRRTHRVRIGPWPIVPTDEARELCLAALRRLWRGESGKLEAPTITATATLAPTLRTILAEYLESRSLSHSANADLRSIVNKHAVLWIDKPIDALEPRSIAQKYRTLASDHPAPANRLLGALSALAKYAHAAHGIGDANVITRARSLLGATEKVEARDVVIGDDVQAAWARAVSAEAAPVGRYLRALLMTGFRANELRKIPSSGWDTNAAVLRVATTKNGKSHSLPCGDALRKLIDEEAKTCNGAAYMFNVPVKVYRAACDRIGKAIGFDWHLHDLRRSFATIATRAGVEADMVKRLMNHSANGDVTQRHYIRLDVEDLRPSMKTVETYLTTLWADSASASTSPQKTLISE